MDQMISIVSSLGTPYADLIWVTLLSAFTYLLVLILTRLGETKPVEIETPEAVEEIPQVDQVEVEDVIGADNKEVLDEFKVPVKEETEVMETEAGPVVEQRVDMARETETPQVEEKLQEPQTNVEVPDEDLTKEGLFSRLKQGLSKTHTGLFGKLDSVFSAREIDSSLWDEFEESLISADIGVTTTMKLRESIEKSLSKQSLSDSSYVKSVLREEILEMLKSAETSPIEISANPSILMIVGVNGVGKTTTIGKLANKFVNDGKKVMVAAADTFRAAAVEQLEVWAKRVGSDFIKGSSGGDPSAVAFDSVKAAVSRGIDVLIIDTAGRLHTKSNLMEELKKIKRVVGRENEGAPHEVLLVLDATTGQNAVQQAKNFNEALDITGLILTKLDGTAKGGVIIAIADELNIPVKYIGIGESLSDLREFNADEFTKALFLTGEENLH